MANQDSNEQSIDAPEADYLYTMPSQIDNAGQGLFTAIEIFKGEQLAIFKGEVLSDSEAKKRAEKNEDQYFINMIDGTIMDSKNTECFAKFANDAAAYASSSFKNNAEISLDDLDQVCIVATKNIKANDEIFCSYGKKYWKKHAEKA